ncbi:MAG TPA: lamin tail domain-containing protein, partial [Anaerolineales bacterium]|nr:lamin tail domain-containing protein [Anaerolineales bacterium]
DNAPAQSATIADFRGNNGCTDTDNNNADFTTGTPAPRNSSSAPVLCIDPLTVTSVAGTASAVNATNTSIALSNTATNTATGTATITNTPPISLTGVVISEFRTRGPSGADDEYIELYNPTTAIVDISGWKINVSNDSGNTSTRATIPAATILRSGQYYLLARSGTSGYSGVVPADQTYGQGITNAGGIALVRPDNTVIDQVGMGPGSAYKEGTPLSPLPSNSNQSYERKLGGASDSCQDTNDNANDFSIITSDPKNYSSQLSRCGTLLTIPVLTTTTITADNPDPSLINSSVIVSVKVTGGSTPPSGQVKITGANSNCTVTLNSSGTGSCSVFFSSTGVKTLTATYLGSQTYLASSDTESHQVSRTIRTPTPTPRFVLPPPPPLVAINEFVPRPGHDWNNDGLINTDDEYIELLNHGVVDVNLAGYRLDDEVNIGSPPFTLPSVILKPGERIVFYGSQTGLLLSDGGDGVRLLKPNGQLADAYNYFVVNFPDQSFCRLPDNGGADDWNTNCYPTPGLRNALSGSILGPPTRGDEDKPLCPIADTLPEEFTLAECPGFGNGIWNRDYWDKFGWYDEMSLPNVDGKWEVYAD